MTFGEFFDEIKSTVCRFVGEKEKTVDEISNGVRNVQGELDNLKSNVEGVDGKISNLEKNLDDKLNGVSGNISTLHNKFDDEFNSLNKNVGEILNFCRNEVETYRYQLTTARDTVNQQEKQIYDLENELKLKNEHLSEATSSLESTLNELTKTQNTLNDERQASAAAKAELQAWTDAVEIYAPVRTAMTKCATFRRMLAERGLTDDAPIGLFNFVQEIGKTMDFVSAVYKAALDLRIERGRQGLNPMPMTPEEVAVYDALNQCYRRIWNVNFDIFTTPGSRKSLVEPFEKTAFNRDEANYFKDPRNKTLKFTQAIYVPLLLNREEKMYKQACVDAGNI